MKEYVDFDSLNSIITSLQERIEEVEEKMTSIENCYPIGAIYISVNATNPGDALGFGTWTRIKDKFLLASGSTYAAGSTGGAATVKLSKANLPAVTGTIAMHSQGVATNIHDVTGCFSSGLVNEDSYRAGGTQTSGAPSHGRINFNNGGSSTAHENMPPYIAVYMWQRTQ